MEELLPKYLKTHTQYLSLCRSREMGCPSLYQITKAYEIIIIFFLLFVSFLEKKKIFVEIDRHLLDSTRVVRDIFFNGEKIKNLFKIVGSSKCDDEFLGKRLISFSYILFLRRRKYLVEIVGD